MSPLSEECLKSKLIGGLSSYHTRYASTNLPIAENLLYHQRLEPSWFWRESGVTLQHVATEGPFAVAAFHKNE